MFGRCVSDPKEVNASGGSDVLFIMQHDGRLPSVEQVHCWISYSCSCLIRSVLKMQSRQE